MLAVDERASAMPSADDIYMAEHGPRLEQAFSQAVNELIREQPADSLTFVVQVLARIAGVTLATGSSTAEAAWAPFEALMGGAPPAFEADKMTTEPKHFLFGQTKAFMDGLPGMLEGGLKRSMEEEARENEGGKWWPEYEYVVNQVAAEDCDLPSTAKFRGQLSSSGKVIVRDAGHAGMTLADFCLSLIHI